jgi:hypothetical protein
MEVNEVWRENGPDVLLRPALAGAATDAAVTNAKNPVQTPKTPSKPSRDGVISVSSDPIG